MISYLQQNDLEEGLHIRTGHGQFMHPGVREYPAGATIFDPSRDTSRIILIKKGWAICSKSLPNGTRIVTDFALRGDVISSAASALSQETIEAISDAVTYEIPERHLDLSPQLYRILLREMIKRQARVCEHLSNIARRDGLERTGHLMLELAMRASEHVRAGLDGFECPLKQSDIGDAVGLSTVHINRVLKDMRLSGLVSFRSGIVEFLDRKRLMEITDFDPSYLESK